MKATAIALFSKYQRNLFRLEGIKGKQIQNGEDLENVIDSIDNQGVQILKSLGLPLSATYLTILRKLALDQKLGLKKAISKLDQIAEEYLITKPSSNTERLKIAKENKETFDDVFAELGIENNLYWRFLYDAVYFQGKCSEVTYCNEVVARNKEQQSIQCELMRIVMFDEKEGRLLGIKNLRKFKLRFEDEILDYILPERKHPAP